MRERDSLAAELAARQRAAVAQDREAAAAQERLAAAVKERDRLAVDRARVAGELEPLRSAVTSLRQVRRARRAEPRACAVDGVTGGVRGR
jgi:hypothetical protein